MRKTRSFRFLDKALNGRLAGLLKRAQIDHYIDEHGMAHYAAHDDEAVEDRVICPIRDEVFSAWQVITCPSRWRGRYRDYMKRHGVPFAEELSNGAVWFLIPRKYRPHTWRLNGAAKNGS
jgi:hypothetical protein